MDISWQNITRLAYQFAEEMHRGLTLYAEILAVVLTASLLGLLVGLMISRSKNKRHLRKMAHSWEIKYKTLETTARSDTQNLEDQLQALANETKAVQSTNNALVATLDKNDASIQKSRAAAIELNRQHAESQEKLLRTIQQKDIEIVELNRLVSTLADSRRGLSATLPTPTVTTNLSITPELDLGDAEAMVVPQEYASAEMMDSNMQIAAVVEPDETTKVPTKPDDEYDDLDKTTRINTNIITDFANPTNYETLVIAQATKNRNND